MRALMLAIGFSMAHVFVPGQAASFATVSHAATAPASTLFYAGRQLGGALGVAILSTVISAVGVVHVDGGRHVANATAYNAAFLTAAAIEALALLLVFRVSDKEAAPSMRRIEPQAVPEPIG
jgi:hypothetical protein